MSAVVQWVVLIDLDHTLLRTEVASQILEQVCEHLALPVAELRQAKELTETGGNSFSPLRYLHSRHNNLDVQSLNQQFIARSKDRTLLFDDALPFLDELKQRQIPFALVTYGDHDWQLLKIRAAGLGGYSRYIIDYVRKGRLVTSWHTSAGYLLADSVPKVVAEQVLLIDDKAASFHDLPDNCLGAWLQRPDEPVRKFQQGYVLKNVHTVTSLHNALDLIA